jgi:predicted lipopolysaccharide heptosyltransferase III
MIIDPHNVRRILVIKLRAVGDVVLSTLVLPNLRAAFPDAELDVLTEKPSIDVVSLRPDVTRVVVYDRAAMSGLGLIRRVRQGRYDLVIDLFGNPRTALVTRLSGARHRVGYEFRGRTYAYNIVATPRGGEVHNSQFNLDALERLGVPIIDRALRFYFGPGDEAYVNRFLGDAGVGNAILVGVQGGGGWYTKRWHLKDFAALADRIHERYGWTIVLPWGPGQKDEVETIAQEMRSRPFILPPTSLPQLAALLKRCAYVVSNDSGPMHIAAAVGTPVLGIFGPTRPELQGPYGPRNLTVRNDALDCLGCNLTSCPIGNPCMNALSVDTVFAAFEKLLQINPR